MKEIENSKNHSINRLEEFKSKINLKKTISCHQKFCIYTTGSYGREEAGNESDIDLFFINSDSEQKFKKIDKILIDADLIGIIRELKFPEFSGDGEYLEVHNIKDIYKELGSRNDDYLNFFTARMLLILESKCLYNENVYDKLIDEILHKYYIDFDKNESFHPMFLVNDIIRFWRTLCLNYEYSRSRNEPDQKQKIKAHIKNYKLKFSRKLTCYSLMLNILFSKSENLTSNELKGYVKLSPLDRLRKIKEENIDDLKINNQIDVLLNLYNNFLEISHKTETELYGYFSDKTNRDKEFGIARKFSQGILDLMLMKRENEKFEYFLL